MHVPYRESGNETTYALEPNPLIVKVLIARVSSCNIKTKQTYGYVFT